MKVNIKIQQAIREYDCNLKGEMSLVGPRPLLKAERGCEVKKMGR